MRLKASLGNDAFWIPPRLWAYAADNQPDGDFSDYSDGEIAGLIGYQGDATSMLQALLKAGFMDTDKKIHGWADYNSYHETYSKRASNAAKAKWDKVREKEKTEKVPERIVPDLKQALLEGCNKDASSITPPDEMNPQPTKESTDRFERLRSALHTAMKRKPREVWGYGDLSMLCEINRREGVEEELTELLAFKEKPGSFFPESVGRLLSTWSETLDRSRQPKYRNGNNSRNGQQVVNGNTGTLNVPSAEKSARYAAIARRGITEPVPDAIPERNGKPS